MGYSIHMHPIKVLTTPEFNAWLARQRDKRAVAAIARRLERAAEGNLGTVKPVGDGVSEMKVDVGQGYRVYFVQRGAVLIVVLSGGDKSSQQRDIKHAKQLAKQLED